MSVERIAVPLGGELSVGARLYEIDSASALKACLVLAHGAGAGHDSPFMVSSARGLAERGLNTVTFNFPYMERRSKVPNPAPQLEACFRAVIKAIADRGALEGRLLLIGGKSLGGRMASHLAAKPDEVAHPIDGLVFLGYPLHPPGRSEQLRVSHLPAIRVPMLFVQGTRDAFGTPDEIASVTAGLTAPLTIHRIDGGDHSFKVRGQSSSLDDILDTVIAWARQVSRASAAL